MVEIPYTPARPSFDGITGFRPSFSLFPDPSSPGLTLIPTKCVQNKQLKIDHIGFNSLLDI